LQTYPDNPVLTRVWRGDEIESQHRGAWVLVDRSGAVLESCGHFEAPVFMRSSVKCLQALPLIESGAADRFGFTAAELALAVASHNGERVHTDGVRALLDRIDIPLEALQCGTQQPADPEARTELVKSDTKPTALHNNCSGKHAGFLALAKHLDAPLETYLAPDSPGQQLVRASVMAMAGVTDEELSLGIDGCSAPTFRFPLVKLATAFARFATPDDLPAERESACTRVLAAVAAHPGLIAGKHKRICTDLARIGTGQLFPKIGAEGIYAIGMRGADRGLAIKVDDGSYRGFHALIVSLLERFGFLAAHEAEELVAWSAGPLENWAGLEVGRIEVVA